MLAQEPQAPKKLRRWRMAQGLTHAAAGDRFDTTRMTWFRWENGETIPNEESMTKLWTAGIVEPNDFYRREKLLEAVNG